MQALRDLLRNALGQSLESLSPVDRLAAAWPVAAGHAIAQHSSVTALEHRIAIVTVSDPAWQQQLQSSADQLQAELARTSRVLLTDILFLLPHEAERRPRTS